MEQKKLVDAWNVLAVEDYIISGHLPECAVGLTQHVYTQPGEGQLWSDHWDGELLLQWIIHQGVLILPNLWSKRSLHCLDSFSTGWFMWGQHLVQSFGDTAKHMCYISHMCHIVTSQPKHPVVSHMSMLLRRPRLLPFWSGQFTYPPKLHLVKVFTDWIFFLKEYFKHFYKETWSHFLFFLFRM